MTSYFNPELMISVMVPEDWTASLVSESKLRFFSLPERGLEAYFDEYRATMSYELIRYPADQKGDWFRNMIQENNAVMEQEYNEYQLISEVFFELGTHPTYRKIYTWTDDGTGLHLYQLQAFIYRGPDQIYLINAAVVENLKDRYLPLFESILESTRIIPSV